MPFFFIDQKYTKETRGPKVSKRVCPYIGINYLLFLCVWREFLLMHSLKKSLSETCMTLLCNYYCFWHVEWIMLRAICSIVSQVCRWISSIFYGFWDKLEQKYDRSNTIKLVFVASPLGTQHWGVTTKTDTDWYQDNVS